VEAVEEFAKLGIPWLALGGGGYDLSAVARCWTLAYGVMLGTEWPDQIPGPFSNQYGLQSLRDTLALDIPSQVRLDARHLAEEGVAAVKEQVFPVHGLGAP
jgi:acetoin utilization protein AcuC